MKYIYLALAIVLEILGSSFLNISEQFKKPIPSIITLVSYLLSFYFLSLTLKSIPLGTTYAIWAGLGIVLTTAVSVIVFKQTIDVPAILGIVLIVAGVLILNLFSKSVSH